MILLSRRLGSVLTLFLLLFPLSACEKKDERQPEAVADSAIERDVSTPDDGESQPQYWFAMNSKINCWERCSRRTLYSFEQTTRCRRLLPW